MRKFGSLGAVALALVAASSLRAQEQKTSVEQQQHISRLPLRPKS
jgi:hypothetical protein